MCTAVCFCGREEVVEVVEVEVVVVGEVRTERATGGGVTLIRKYGRRILLERTTDWKNEDVNS